MRIGDSVVIQINPYPYLREIKSGVITSIRTEGVMIKSDLGEGCSITCLYNRRDFYVNSSISGFFPPQKRLINTNE